MFAKLFKFNPNHDSRGRFTSRGGAGSEDRIYTFYHGTSSAVEESIKKFGLITRAEGALGGGYDWAMSRGYTNLVAGDVGERKASVFISQDLHLAHQFAVYAADVTKSTPVIVELKMPKKLLDEKAIQDNGTRYRAGLEFHGTIKPQYISRFIPIKNPRNVEDMLPVFASHHKPVDPLPEGVHNYQEAVSNLMRTLETRKEDTVTLYAVVMLHGEEEPVTKFDPNQPRAKDGRWTTGGPEGMFFDQEKKDWVHPTREVTAEEKARLNAAHVFRSWKDVRLNPDPNHPLIAVGRNAKGDLQYNYSKARSEKNDPEKFARAKAYNEMRPKLLEQEVKMMNDKSLDIRTRDAAATLYLVDRTLVRHGGPTDARLDYEAKGASTLTKHNVQVHGDEVVLNFVGKKNVHQYITVQDPTLAKYISMKKRQGHATEPLFISSTKRDLELLHTLTGNPNFRVHDIRTWGGTAIALAEVQHMQVPSTQKEFVRARNQVAKVVASKLGNTPAAALSAYIDPTVFKNWAYSKTIKKADGEYDMAYLEQLMNDFYANTSYDEYGDWESNPATDFDPDENPEDAVKLQAEVAHGLMNDSGLAMAGSGVGHMLLPSGITVVHPVR